MPAGSTPQQPLPDAVPVVDCALYEHGRRRPGALPVSEAMQAVRDSAGGFVWIGLREPTAGQFQAIADAFGLHPLAAKNTVTAHQRPKPERNDDALFLVLKTPRSSPCPP